MFHLFVHDFDARGGMRDYAGSFPAIDLAKEEGQKSLTAEIAQAGSDGKLHVVSSLTTKAWDIENEPAWQDTPLDPVLGVPAGEWFVASRDPNRPDIMIRGPFRYEETAVAVREELDKFINDGVHADWNLVVISKTPEAS